MLRRKRRRRRHADDHDILTSPSISSNDYHTVVTALPAADEDNGRFLQEKAGSGMLNYTTHNAEEENEITKQRHRQDLADWIHACGLSLYEKLYGDDIQLSNNFHNNRHDLDKYLKHPDWHTHTNDLRSIHVWMVSHENLFMMPFVRAASPLYTWKRYGQPGSF